MAASTVAKDSKIRVCPYAMTHEFVMTTGDAFLKGCVYGVSAAGLLTSVNANIIKVVGRACRTVTAAAAGETLEVEQGIILLDNLATAVAVAQRFDPCYLADNQSVNLTNTNPFCGIVYDVTSEGVWVFISPFTALAYAA